MPSTFAHSAFHFSFVRLNLMTIPAATTAFPNGAASPADGSDAAARRDGGLWARNPRTGEVDYFVVPPTPGRGDRTGGPVA